MNSLPGHVNLEVIVEKQYFMISANTRKLFKQLQHDLVNHPDYALRRCRTERVLGQRDILACFNSDDNIAQRLDLLINQGTLIKHDATSTVARAQIANGLVIVKRYNKRGFMQSLKTLASGSRAEKGLYKALLLKYLGIPTPEPLMYCVTYRHGLAANSYLVLACSAGETLCDLFDTGRLEGERWELAIANTKDILDCLHSNGITHGDIKTPNVLFDGKIVEIVDLDPMRIHRFDARFRRFQQKDLNTYRERVKNYPNRNGVK